MSEILNLLRETDPEKRALRDLAFRRLRMLGLAREAVLEFVASHRTDRDVAQLRRAVQVRALSLALEALDAEEDALCLKP